MYVIHCLIHPCHWNITRKSMDIGPPTKMMTMMMM